MTSSPPGNPTAHRSAEHGLGVDRLGWGACVLVLAGFVASVVAWLTGGFSFAPTWVPTLDLRLDISFDGLAALYAILATGIGVVTFAYGTSYLSRHLAHEGRPAAERWRFWPWMVLFAVAMVGLAMSQNLVLLFLCFDLTAVCSYFLIGHDRTHREARTAALMALLVTAVTAVCLLVAAVVLYEAYGTFAVPELVARVESGPTVTTAAALMGVAALAKSAQVPFHFWLPRAMTAPTPVSAYLHSAAMVAAGVLLLGRVHPLLARSEVVLDALVVVGSASILVGGVLALGADRLKQVLAFSTISQYGYVVLLYGIGGPYGNGAAAFYVLAHGVAKSALFMTAGAVTLATGEDRLSRLGGVWRQAPLLAAAAFVAAATLAAFPLTVGFFKDELFFAAARAEGPVLTGVAVVAAGLTFAYLGRFWWRLFAGRPHTERAPFARLTWPLVFPVVVLAVVSLVGGTVVRPFARLAEDAARVTHGGWVDLAPAYHLDARPENLMALGAWALGGVLMAMPAVTSRVSRWVAAAGERCGPRLLYFVLITTLFAVSAALHEREVRDLRTSVAAVMVPAGVLTAIAFAVTPTEGAYRIGFVTGFDWLILPLLALVAIATVTVATASTRLVMVLALSVVGFALAAVYALVDAPDVALVAVVVETMITLVFIAALAWLPKAVRQQARRENLPGGRTSRRGTTSRPAWRNVAAAVVAGGAVFAAVWGFLSQPATAPSVAAEQVRRTPSAHGGDVVTVIVADFRGLDTAVEITVLLVAVVGVATLLRRGRLW